MERGTIPGDGVSLAFARWPGDGAPVVALHGVTSSHLSFAGIAERLDGARPLVALDLRGHGASDGDPPHTLEHHARDVAAAMRALDLGASLIVGHSFGAYVAGALAAAEPQLVAALLFVDGGHPPPAPAGLSARAYAELAMAPSLDRIGRVHASVEEHVAAWRAMPAVAEARADWLAAYAEYDAGGAPPHVRSRPSEAAVRAAYYDMVEVAAVEARLRRVTVPLEVVRAGWGALRGLPPLISDGVMAAIARAVPQARLRTVAQANHYTVVLGETGADCVAQAIRELAP